MSAARHPELDDRLLELLYGELPPSEADALRAALAADPEANARFEGWAAVRQIAAELPEPEPDPQVHYDILRAARQAAEPAEKRGLLHWLTTLSFNPAFAGLGLAVLAAGALVFFTRGYEDTVAPTQSPAMVEAARAPVVDEASEAPRSEATAAASSEAEEQPAPIRGADSPEGDARQPAKLALPGPVGGAAVEMKDANDAPAKAEEKEGAVPLDDGDGDAAGAELARARGRRAARTSKKKAAVPRRARRAKDDTQGRSEPFAPSVEKPAPPAVAAKVEPAADPAPLADPFPGEATVVADGRAGGVADGKEAPESGERAAEARQAKGAPKTASIRVPTDVGDDGVEDQLAAGRDVVVAGDLAEADEAKAAEAPDRFDAAEAEADLDLPSDGRFSGGAGVGAAPPVPQQAGAPAAVPQRPAEAPAPVAAREVGQSAGGEGSGGLPAPLSQARAARSRGDHRVAVQAYNQFFDGHRGHAQFTRSLYEAATSYEALGDTSRAIQLYRLVVGKGGEWGARARARLNRLESLRAGRPAPRGEERKKPAALQADDLESMEAPEPVAEPPPPKE